MNSIMPTRRAFFGLIGIGAALAPFAKAIASVGPEAATITDLKVTNLKIGSTGITMSGKTTLAEWRDGSNATMIEGSKIMPANITATRVVFGPRSCIRLID